MRDAPALGQMVYEIKRMPFRLGIVCMLVAAALGGAGAYLLVQSASNVTASATLLGLAGVALVSPLILPGQRLRFHENGLIRTEPLAAPVVLAYDAVEAFSWAIVWPGLGLTITGHITGAGRKFDFMLRLLDSDSPVRTQLDAVRDRIAEAVATRALQRIQSRQAFEWGSDRGLRVQLREEGLAYRPAKFIGAREEQLVPWTTVLKCTIDNGVCRVFAEGHEKQLFAVACGDRNFYPGLQVLAALGTLRP